MEATFLSKFRTISGLIDYFDSDARCHEFLAMARWNGKPKCPYCGCDYVYHRKDGRYACKDCKKTFTVLVGTVFQSTKLKLIKWFIAIHLLCNSKQGVSSTQLAREICVTQKTAWFMLQKLRVLLRNKNDPFVDTIEDNIQVCRNDCKRPVSIKIFRRPTKLHPELLRFVQPETRIFTDALICYQTLEESEQKRFRTEDPYSWKSGSDNSAEEGACVVNGFWMQIKRMVSGIYHYVSRSLVHRYVYEALFRGMTRRYTNDRRFMDVMGRVGKVVPYRMVRTM